jgi:hypothetical protein
VTHVDINDRVPDTRQISISARHEAELVDGGRLLLLDDRGWTSSPSISAISKGPGDSWQRDVAERVVLSVEEIERTARLVAGPMSRTRNSRAKRRKRRIGPTWPPSSRAMESS